MLERIVLAAPVFLLIFARIFALVRTAPLLSSGSFPGVARVALAFFAAFAIFPGVVAAGYPIPATVAGYILLMVGEVLIGLISALFLVILFAVFSACRTVLLAPDGVWCLPGVRPDGAGADPSRRSVPEPHRDDGGLSCPAACSESFCMRSRGVLPR